MQGLRFVRSPQPVSMAFRLLLLFLVAACLPAQARVEVIPSAAAIASAHPLATRAGQEILQAGGNAFDAAVAVSAALAVVEPYSSGLGGGGFWLLHRASDARELMLDGRETAPSDSYRDMYLDAAGKPIPNASLEGAQAAAIPGLPAALVALSHRFGRLPLKIALAPAIRYAREGFKADDRYLLMVQSRVKLLQSSPAASEIFLDHGEMPKSGFVLRQRDLARTLEAIARHGNEGFYRGPVARELVRATRKSGGLWQSRDLRAYRVVEREPLKAMFLGRIAITSAALPSSGGVTLAETLNILERTPYADSGPELRAHFLAEAWRRAYFDRARFLGDPAFVQAPLQRLLSKAYADTLASSISPERAGSSERLEAGAGVSSTGASTTHFSIIDSDGNRVAATLSINTTFGSVFVAGSTGVVLNNEMDDFSVSPGVPNAYGLVGSRANMIEPGKRPLSSMAPTFVEDERGLLILGTPGGSRIISMLALAICDYATQLQPDVARIVAAPRIHHQYLPDRIEIEPDAFSADYVQRLEAQGHKVQTAQRKWGNMQALFIDKRTGRATAASDPRGIGGSAWY